jgi:hypothetical protein
MTKYKKEILDIVFNNYNKFYIHVAPLSDVVIGKRGFLDQEKDHGIVLVFGNESYKNFEWDENNIYVSMKFSGVWEELIIPFGAIQAVFDNPVNPNFIFNFKVSEEINNQEDKKVTKIIKKDNVISLDFRKKR